MVDLTLPLPGLSPVAGKELVARFDGGRLSSDGGLLVLREIEQRLKVADRLAACIEDPRDPGSTMHTLADIIRFRLLMIAAGYEDGNDATGLRRDPVFKMALDRLSSDRDLCSQSTISRLENLPEKRTLLRLARALVELYRGSFRQVPRRITLDIDDTFDAVHGGQQLRLFNAHYRLRLPADRRLRWRGPLRHRRPAPGEAAEGHRDPCLSAPPGAGDPRYLAAGGDPAARRQPLRLSGSPRLVRGERRRPRPRPRPDRHVEAPCRRPGGKHCGAFRGRSERRQGPPLQGILRRRQDLEPGPPHRRPRRGRRRRHRYPLHRHQPRPRQRPIAVPGPLLPARTGGEPHQGLESPPRRRPNFVSQGHRQPVPPVPARRRLLAAVEPARADAQGLVLAGRPVRHPQAPFDQDRRPHRRDENAGQNPLADERARSTGRPPRPRPRVPPRHLTAGAARPAVTRSRQPLSPATPLSPNAADRGHPRLAFTTPRRTTSSYQKTLIHSGASTGLVTSTRKNCVAG